LNNLPCHITGIPGHNLENVHLENISFTVPGGSAAVDSTYIVPENIEDRPEMDLFGNVLPAYGIYFRHVTGLTLDSVCFTPLQPDARAMIWVDDVQNISSQDVCQPIVEGVNEISLQNNFTVIYDAQNNFLEIKNAENGKLSVYSIDGRLILSEQINSSHQILNCSAFPFAWKFESKNDFQAGRIWIRK